MGKNDKLIIGGLFATLFLLKNKLFSSSKQDERNITEENLEDSDTDTRHYTNFVDLKNGYYQLKNLDGTIYVVGPNSHCVNMKIYNANFSNMNLANCNFTGTTFHDCNLYNTNLLGSNLCSTQFHGCNLKKTIFTSCTLHKAIISNCTLYQTNFKWSTLTNCLIECDELDSCFYEGALWNECSKFGDESFDIIIRGGVPIFE